MKLGRLAAAFLSVALLSVGGLLVPLGFAVFAGFRAANSTSELEEVQRSSDMMAIYRITAPPIMILSSMNFDQPIDGCDIEPQKIFSKSHDILAEPVRNGEKREFNSYTGYFMLIMWRSSNWSIAVRERQRNFVSRNFSPFSQGFLTACMRYTLFSNQCADRVRFKFEEAEWSDPVNTSSLPNSEFRPDSSFEDNVICTYLKGVAATEQGRGSK